MSWLDVFGFCESRVWMLIMFRIVTHALEIPYVYGVTTGASRLLSVAMMDYWLSFVVSQTPNDGKGVSRAYRNPLPRCVVLTFATFRDYLATIYLR